MFDIGKKVVVVNGTQLFFVKALVPENAAEHLGVGLNVKATIHTNAVSPWEYVERTFAFSQ